MFRKAAALVIALGIFATGCIAEPQGGAQQTPEPAITSEPNAMAEPVATVTEEPAATETAEPTATVTAESTATATAEPTATVTAEPAETVTAEATATAEPTANAAAASTAQPAVTETAAPMNSQMPEVSDAPAEEVTPEPVPTPDPAAQAWFISADGQLICGDLNLILPMAQPQAQIYIMADENVLMWAVDFNQQLVDELELEFLLDVEKYDEDMYELKVQFEPPEGMEQTDTEHEYIYIWVEKKSLVTPEPTEPAAEEPIAIEISVESADYAADAWSCVRPVFTLGGIPEGDGRYTYAAIVYDERFVILSGNTYTARDEGVYDVRFAILDGIGDVVSISEKYPVMLDFTAPAYLTVEMAGDSYTDFSVYTEDALSGVASYSIDGGATWTAPGEDGAAAFTGESGATIAAGNILAMDAAGNIAEYSEDFTLPEKVSSGGYYGGGGGGGGSGEGSAPHSPTDKEVELSAYNALELEISSEPMNTLVIGDTELELALALVSAVGFEPDAEYQPLFTAELAAWSTFDPNALPADEEETEATAEDDGETAAEDDGEVGPDTLILTVADEALVESEYSYMFTFNGVVCRTLFNSGIDYLVLRAGDDCVALSTAGFTAGSEYTRLKTEGVSTRKFDYSMLLMGDKLGLRPFEMTMEVSINQDDGVQVYPLTDDHTQDMYYCDVQVGDISMMDVAFGAYVPEEAEGETTNE